MTTKSATDSTGAAIDGSAITSLAGCIVGKTGETGQNVSTRLAALLNDTAQFAHVTGTDGKPVFSDFEPGAPSGSVTSPTGLVQNVNVTLNMFGSPSSQLQVTRKQAADGSYSVHITNLTDFKASIAFFPVTAIDAGNLTLDVVAKPQANGLTITGGGSVQLDVEKDQASSASQIVTDVFNWLTTTLAS